MSWLYNSAAYLASAAYNAYYGSAESEPEIEVSSPTPALHQVLPSGEPVNPLYSGSGAPQTLQQRINTVLPLPLSTTTSNPVDDEEAQLQLALRLSAQHPQLPVVSPTQTVPSLTTPPVARNTAPVQQQQLGLDDDAALAEAIRLSTQHAQQRPTPPVSSLSQPRLTEEEELEKALKLSLQESKSTAATHSIAQSYLGGITSTTSKGKSLAEQEAEAIELATKRSMSKEQDQYVPMLGKRVLVTDIIAEKRRAVQEEQAKMPSAQGDAKAMQWMLERIERNGSIADQLTSIAHVYKYFQPVRGDGNCFYTSFAFDMLLGFAKLTVQQKADLIDKFEKCHAPRDAKEAAVAALRNLQAGGSIRGEDKLMLDFVQCLRAIGVQYVQENRAHLEPFLVEPMTYDKLVLELGKMGEYAQEPMIVALVNAVDHPIRVVRVTPKVGNIVGTAGSFNYDSQTRQIPADREPARVLLYTDGHYQMLSKN